VTNLYYVDGPPCRCRAVDDDCAGCQHARFTSFLRGWSWITLAIERTLR